MKRYVSNCDDCGWTSTLTRSPAQAHYAHRKHSCDKQRAKNAARDRGIARHASIDRTPKPCHHKQARHVHGTRACYVLDRCRCLDCSTANTAYEKQRTRQQAYGRWNGYVDAEPARQHVQALLDAGMGLKRIVAVGGTNSGQLWKLMYGKTRSDGSRTPSKRIRPDVAERILAIRLDLADGAKVPGVGTTRRIQALVALGWSQSKLAERLGIHPGNFTPIAQGRRGVTAATSRAIAALYDELWDRQPANESHGDKVAVSRSLAYAKQHGWAPPLAWDDDTIDDPDAHPFIEAAEKRPGGKSVHVDDIEWLLDHEPLATAQRLGDRLGVHRSTIQHTLSRAERRDLLDLLARNAVLAKEGVA